MATRGQGEGQVACEAVEQGFEPTDFSISGTVLAAGALVLIVVVAGLALWAMTTLFAPPSPRLPPGALEREAVIPPPPRLQADPSRELREVQSRAQRVLTTWGWIDRDAEIVHIPIDEAMTMIARRGWPSPSPDAGESGESGAGGTGQVIRRMERAPPTPEGRP